MGMVAMEGRQPAGSNSSNETTVKQDTAVSELGRNHAACSCLFPSVPLRQPEGRPACSLPGNCILQSILTDFILPVRW